jgi:predicted ATPase with chaperone activity
MSTNFLDLPEPRSLQDAGIGSDQVEQLLVKTLYSGEATGLEIADRICLPFTLLEALIERLRNERLMEVKGAGSSGASTYRYALTDSGRERARQYMEVSHYVGAAPVSLARYVAYMTALQAARGYMDKERLRNGFSHLIISDEVLEMVGPAVNAGKAVFLYGPPGNGKSVIAEGMGRSLGGDMHIPRAIDVDGHTVMMYDPIVHESLENPRESSIVVGPVAHDRRWVRIRRPVVMVGGELTLDMLDLRFNPTARFYEAPIQLKANGGVFLVDDFGRQRMRPQDLLNRWIVPLESRIDHLTLHSGKKFVVPFDTLVVFATNLPPESLADEAFLRRIPYKIAIEDPSLDEFTKIFELNCKRRNMRFHQVMVAYLQRRHYKPSGRPLRACHPRDLLDQVSALCRYRGVEPTITRELLDAACKSYFVGEAPVPQLPATPKSSARRMDVH